jgi:hypothetical protein
MKNAKQIANDLGAAYEFAADVRARSADEAHAAYVAARAAAPGAGYAAAFRAAAPGTVAFEREYAAAMYAACDEAHAVFAAACEAYAAAYAAAIDEANAVYAAAMSA